MGNYNIYNIDAWAASTNYQKNKIVIINNYYYYALSAHLSGSTFATDLANGLWGGRIVDQGENKPHFIWTSAYSHSTDNEPTVKRIQFGDSYKQILNDGINNIIPILNLEFECDLDRCCAILHFLESRSGSESFAYLPAAPRGTLARFICTKWTDSQLFYNNYKIQTIFERSIT